MISDFVIIALQWDDDAITLGPRLAWYLNQSNLKKRQACYTLLTDVINEFFIIDCTQTVQYFPVQCTLHPILPRVFVFIEVQVYISNTNKLQNKDFSTLKKQ